MLRDLAKALIKAPLAVLEGLLVLPLMLPSIARGVRLKWRRATGQTSKPEAQHNEPEA